MKTLSVTIASVLFALSAQSANAWTYTCAAQKISHQNLTSLSVTSAFGDFVTLRLFVEGQDPYTVPTMLAQGNNDFISHDDDAEVMINPFTDSDGMMSVWIKVKSLHIKGDLACRAGF